MTTLKLTLEYDGTGFHGWARQPGRRTVEGTLRGALDATFPRWDALAVAGRTDAGVHASGQVASVVVEGGPPAARVVEALNAALSADVAVVASELVPDGFHARFSATARWYSYAVLQRRSRSPLRAARSLWWPHELDLEALAVAAALLIGEHDFTAFTPTETQHRVFVRHVRDASWERRGDELWLTIGADSFLRHMVRTIVGTMLEAGADAPDRLEWLLEGRPRSEAGTTAPAHGLTLERVEFA